MKLKVELKMLQEKLHELAHKLRAATECPVCKCGDHQYEHKVISLDTKLNLLTDRHNLMTDHLKQLTEEQRKKKAVEKKLHRSRQKRMRTSVWNGRTPTKSEQGKKGLQATSTRN